MPSKRISSSPAFATPLSLTTIHNKSSKSKAKCRKQPSAQITTVSDRQLTDLLTATKDSTIVVLKCFASYCRGCKGVEPKYRKIAAAYEEATVSERPSVRFCQMDYARNEQFCKDTLGVQSLPFFGIWKDGKYVGGEAIGWQNVAKRLVEKIDSLADSAPKSPRPS